MKKPGSGQATLRPVRARNLFQELSMCAQAASATPSGRSGETVERVAAALKAGILEGRFAPGQRLISRDIVERFDVGRSSLREAFRRLEADGLVDIIPNRGAVVRSLTPEHVRQLFEIREALEGYAARQAAKNIGRSGKRAEFEAILARGRRHGSQAAFAEFMEDNRAFHQAIVDLADNPMLGQLIEKHHLPVFMLQLRQVISVEQMIRNSLEEHEAIAAGILAGDGDAAYAAMKRHLWHSADQILSRLEASSMAD